MNIKIAICKDCGYKEEYFSEITVWNEDLKVWEAATRPTYVFCENCGSTNIKEVADE